MRKQLIRKIKELIKNSLAKKIISICAFQVSLKFVFQEKSKRFMLIIVSTKETYFSSIIKQKNIVILY